MNSVPDGTRNPTERPLRTADEAYVDYLLRRAGGEQIDLAAFAREHADLAAGLEDIDRSWQRLAGVHASLEIEKSVSALAARHSDAAQDPGSALAAGSEQPFTELLARLGRRTVGFGRYRIHGEVGRGGMGVVLRVWDEELKRHLAMKVVLGREGIARSGTTPPLEPKTLGRFVEEAQVTAQLDHPSIVPVHELGLDDQGRLYFTMRLVKGTNLAQVFALASEAREGWTQTRVLGVLLKACEALAYAHSKGVIHRDLKPTNVMVGGFGEAYVMDWGLAKVLGTDDKKDLRIRPEQRAVPGPIESERRALAAGDPESPLYTMDGDVVGTPAYMPPEQARGEIERIGPHSDVYSMGAILYHLLVGHLPYAGPGSRLNNYAIWARVRQGPPESVHQLAPDQPLELAAICEKAMARDPAARYPTMVELAEDLRAYLENRVVKAHRTGAVVELKKWVVRNRALASALAAGILVLVLGLAGTSTQYVRAEDRAQAARGSALEARDQAQIARANAERAEREAQAALAAKHAEEEQRKLATARAEEVEKVAEFQASMLSDINPDVMGHSIVVEMRKEVEAGLARVGRGEEDRRRVLAGFDEAAAPANATNVARLILDSNVLHRASEAIGKDFDNQPLVEATLRTTLGDVYDSLALCDQALAELSRAVELRRRELGEDDLDTLRSVNDLSLVLWRTGRFGQAEPMLREVLEKRRRLLGEDDIATVTSTHGLALILEARGTYDEAESLLRAAVAGLRRVLGEEQRDTITAIGNLGQLLRVRGKLAEAESLLREGLELADRALGDGDPTTITVLNNLSVVLSDAGKQREAEAMIRTALERNRRIVGDDHPDTIGSLNNLGTLLQEQHRLDQAEPYLREGLERSRRVLGEKHSRTLMLANNFALLLQNRGALDQAEPILRELLASFRESEGDDSASTITLINNLSRLLKDKGELDEAEALAREACERSKRALGAGHPSSVGSLDGLAKLLRARGRLDEAEALFREALGHARLELGADNPETLKTMYFLADLLRSRGSWGAAEELLLELESRLDPNSAFQGLTRRKCIESLVELYQAWHVAEPERGHAQQAEEWKQRLGALPK